MRVRGHTLVWVPERYLAPAQPRAGLRPGCSATPLGEHPTPKPAYAALRDTPALTAR
jgi:hypothetical protein